jgi:shikimate kinase
MSIVLIGYRGSGKTTIGKRLADRLWQTFVDVDELIVRKAGRSIRDIFEQEGEESFRTMESEVLREVALLEDHVIATGGGSLMREENRKALKDAGHRIIYLKCDPDLLWQRIQTDPNTSANRPDLTPTGGVEEIRQKIAEREPVYRQVMHAELDVSNLTPEDAVVYIVRLL